jgi:hypothetical protein
VTEPINIDESGRPVQDVFGGPPAPTPSVGPEQSSAASSGEVHDGGQSPAAVDGAELAQTAPGESEQSFFDGGAPS